MLKTKKDICLSDHVKYEMKPKV